MTQRNKKGILPKPLGMVLTILIVLAIPLPFALYLAGIDWITSGSHGVPKEFIVSYLLGLVLLCGSIAIAIYKDRRNKK